MEEMKTILNVLDVDAANLLMGTLERRGKEKTTSVMETKLKIIHIRSMNSPSINICVTNLLSCIAKSRNFPNFFS